MKQALLIFVKNLIHGQVKTRLAATVGNDMALTVYQKLLQHTVTITHQLTLNKIVFYSNSLVETDIWKNNVYNKQLQSGIDLGERMQNAFIAAFENGNNRVAIIGSDCFELTSTIILKAFENLKNNDVVIGPAKDGGYYLLAIKKNHPQLFQNINWSTDEVLKQTLSVCNNLNLSVYLLPELTDIDNENDLNKIKDKLFSPKEIQV
ncbi:MAG: TIGR04282 family arsenosugar biosynthesis glycosyltransferase [Bacteroidota bacterium]|nr:TIGR04282 family arsenosugar biosynthesis glycosyltransferase [Bacteroidota bacterium]